MKFNKSTLDRNIKKLYAERKRIRNYLLVGINISLIYACLEYIARLNTDFPQEFIPLIIRVTIVGQLIMMSVVIFEILLKDRFTQKRFFYLVLVRSMSYTFIITLWLVTINGIWYTINEENVINFHERIIKYIIDDMYLINISFIFTFAILSLALTEINSLHRKGELLNFILGKYHTPREIDRIFCFIDLKDSTTIAENLGHLRFAMFLKDYYSDITEAIRKTNAQIYQYVGDEIVLSWSYKNGLMNNNLINCFFQMEEIIDSMKDKYKDKYGVYPRFKAGIHGGKVIVTWVGEIKKEIVYIGDVLNTAARIQEDCKRLAKDFLISEDLLNKIQNLGDVKASFVEETILRGKKRQINLYSLELAG